MRIGREGKLSCACATPDAARHINHITAAAMLRRRTEKQEQLQILPSSPRNGCAVVARGAAPLRGVSKGRRERPRPILRGSPLRGEHLRMTEIYVAALRKRVMTCPAPLHRADLEHFAVVTCLGRDAQLTAAIFPGHDRHHGDDRFASGIVERVPDSAVLAELYQIARGWK